MKRTIFYPIKPEYRESWFNNGSDCGKIYGDVKEETPKNTPDTFGNSVKVSCFVDSNHYGNFVMRQSHSGVLMFVNNTP